MLSAAKSPRRGSQCTRAQPGSMGSGSGRSGVSRMSPIHGISSTSVGPSVSRTRVVLDTDENDVVSGAPVVDEDVVSRSSEGSEPNVTRVEVLDAKSWIGSAGSSRGFSRPESSEPASLGTNVSSAASLSLAAITRSVHPLEVSSRSMAAEVKRTADPHFDRPTVRVLRQEWGMRKTSSACANPCRDGGRDRAGAHGRCSVPSFCGCPAGSKFPRRRLAAGPLRTCRVHPRDPNVDAAPPPRSRDVAACRRSCSASESYVGVLPAGSSSAGRIAGARRTVPDVQSIERRIASLRLTSTVRVPPSPLCRLVLLHNDDGDATEHHGCGRRLGSARYGVLVW